MKPLSYLISPFFSCLAALLAASISQAATITVDQHGGGDTTTIQAALYQAGAGDEVIVEPGVYTENLVLASGVRLISRDGAEATIVDGQGQKCFEVQYCAPGTLVRGFTITNGGGMQGGGFWIFGNSHVEIADNIIRNNQVGYEGAAIQVQLHSYADIHDNRIIANRSPLTCGITVIKYSTADIRNNIFQDNVSDSNGTIGVHESHVEVIGNLFEQNQGGDQTGIVDFYKATGVVSNNVFVGNTSAPDGASGVAIRHSSSRVTVVRNIFSGNNIGPALRTTDCQSVSCNIFWANTSDHAGLCPPIGQDGNINVDPLLCPDQPDQVQAGSPALTSDCGHIGLAMLPVCGH